MDQDFLKWFDRHKNEAHWSAAVRAYVNSEHCIQPLRGTAQDLLTPSLPDLAKVVASGAPHPSILAYAAFVGARLGLTVTLVPCVTARLEGTHWVMLSGNCRQIECELDSFDGINAIMHVTKSVNITTQELRSRAPYLRTGPNFNTVPKNLKVSTPIMAKTTDDGQTFQLTHINGEEIGDLQITPLQMISTLTQ